MTTTRTIEDRMEMWIAGLQVDAQRLLLHAKHGTPEKRLASEVLGHIAEWKEAKGLQKNFQPGGSASDPD